MLLDCTWMGLFWGSLSLIFDSFLKCVSEKIIWVKFHGDLLASWNWISKYLPRFGKSAIISLDKLSASSSLFSPSGTPVIHRLFLLLCFISPIGFLHSFSLVFIFALLTDLFKWSVLEFTDAFFASTSWWLKLYIEFFSLVILFFSSKISVLFLAISKRLCFVGLWIKWNWRGSFVDPWKAGEVGCLPYSPFPGKGTLLNWEVPSWCCVTSAWRVRWCRENEVILPPFCSFVILRRFSFKSELS